MYKQLTLSDAGVWRLYLGLCAKCITRHLFWLVISPSCCSRQGPPLWNWGNFDHFNPLQTTLNVIWLKKVVPNLPFTYLGKVKKNWQLFPLLFSGNHKSMRGGGGGALPALPPHPIGLKAPIIQMTLIIKRRRESVLGRLECCKCSMPVIALPPLFINDCHHRIF